MKILFVKPKHIGDSLILTPTIVATKKAYPDSEIWVLVRRGCDEILAGCPEIDHIRTIAPVEDGDRTGRDLWRDLLMLLNLRKVKFDYIFELGDGHSADLCHAQPFGATLFGQDGEPSNSVGAPSIRGNIQL